MSTVAEHYMAYVRGWRAGATFDPVDPQMNEHADKLLQLAYLDGWGDGRSASKRAFREARAALGILQDGEKPPQDRKSGDPE